MTKKGGKPTPSTTTSRGGRRATVPAKATPATNTRFIVACVTILAVIAGALGVWLVLIGYHGDLLLMCVPSAITGLFGMLSQRQPSTPPKP